MEALDLLSLDRSVGRAVRAARRFERTMREAPLAPELEEERWFDADRAVTTRSTFLQVADIDPSDPLRAALLGWIRVLVRARVAQPATLAVHRHRALRAIELERPERARMSVRDLIHRCLGEPSAPKRALFLEALASGAERVRAAERDRAEALREIDRRLGLEPGSAPSGTDPAATRTVAEAVLAETDDLARTALGTGSGVPDLIARLVARDVPGVWPAHAGDLWLRDLFGATPLLAGLDLDMGRAPTPIGASTFARILARFGAAYARAATSPSLPFVLSSDPAGVRASRRGALFALLLSEPVFLRRALGLSREQARAIRRALAIPLLAQARIDSTRALVDIAVAAPKDIEAAFERALCAGYPRALAGVLPRPSDHAPARLVGLLLALDDREALVLRYDEDWFRNPRALESLRESDAGAVREVVAPDQAAPKRWARLVEGLLEDA